MSEYRLHIIGSFTPTSFPMARLATYIAACAKVLGGDGDLHLESIEEGSTVLAARVGEARASEVAARCEALASGKADDAAWKAFDELDTLLCQDKAVGRLEGAGGAIIVDFPGCEKTLPPDFGPVWKEGTRDGRLTRIGGKDQTSHAQLCDGDDVSSVFECTPDLAREMAQNLFKTLRVRGTGKWVRRVDGVWELQKFRISSFEVLPDTSLRETIDELRAVKGSQWGDVEDPVRTLMDERHGIGGHH